MWYAPLVFDRTKPEAVVAAAACCKELLLTGRAKGWFPYRVGINTLPTLVGMQSDATAFHTRLRAELDPHDLLAPGS